MDAEMLPVAKKHKATPLFIPEQLEKSTLDYIQPAYKWLKDIYDAEFAEYKKYRAQVTEDVWDSYAILPGNDLPEYTRMKAIITRFKQLYGRNRPQLFKKGTYKECLKG